MTPEQQRIAIAEVCGWRWITPSLLCGYAPWHKQYRGTDIPTDGSLPFDQLPDYLSDLNAMHVAEKHVKAVWGKYVKQLNAIADPACATAAQRAEAFLQTLNLWTE